jgi:hypothetical protein
MRNKCYVLFIAFVLFIILSGCAKGETAPAGTSAEIADKIFANAQVESFGMSQTIETEADMEFYLGSTEYPAFADAFAVTPMINIDTRVLIILKAADSSNVDEIKAKLEENIDPNKVVCVTFTLEDVEIESRGDVIFLTINTDPEQRSALLEAFRTIE